MNHIITSIIYSVLNFVRRLLDIPKYVFDLLKFKKLYKGRLELFPVLGENTSSTSFDRHYIFHTA